MQNLVSQVLATVEQTKQQFLESQGKNCEAEKRLFINWYIENHKGSLRSLIYDLSEYYLHISEDRIIRYINEKG